MATSFTFTATGATTSSPTWTETSLTSHILGEINDDANTTGTPPDRMTRATRAAKLAAWYAADWLFKRKEGTITTTASQAHVLLPADFDKFDVAWLSEANEAIYTRLRITTDSRDYTKAKDRFGQSDDESEPFLGYVTNVSSRWRLKLVPTPDDAYEYTIVYYTKLDTVSIPEWFHELWELGATWRIQKHFRGDDEWIAAKAIYEDALERAIQENNELIAVPGTEGIVRGYEDADFAPTLLPEDDSTWPLGTQ